MVLSTTWVVLLCLSSSTCSGPSRPSMTGNSPISTILETVQIIFLDIKLKLAKCLHKDKKHDIWGRQLTSRHRSVYWTQKCMLWIHNSVSQHMMINLNIITSWLSLDRNNWIYNYILLTMGIILVSKCSMELIHTYFLSIKGKSDFSIVDSIFKFSNIFN